LFPSAFASINASPASQADKDRKRAQGKRHNQTIVTLAQRRTGVLYATLCDGTFYTEPTPSPVALVA